MIATTHVIIGGAVGVAVGSITQNPAAALAAGFVSHIICDAIPHLDGPINVNYHNPEQDQIVWTKGLFTFALSDSIIAFLGTLFIWWQFFDLYFFSVYAWGALGAYLPDFIDLVPWWNEQIRTIPGFKQFQKIHIGVHNLWRYRYPMQQYWPLGIATQLALTLPCLWYIISK